MTPRKTALVWRLVIPVAIAILPLTLAAQNGAPGSPDDILKADSYQTPPRELADAVLAPRYLNVTLTNASPDKKWFLDEIGDGPVVMKTFSKPFHELGGVFIDFKANRARPLTVRNNIGIQLDLRRRRHEEGDPAAGRRARVERGVVARRQERRVLRPRRGRDAHLDRGRRDRPVAPGDEDPGARDARQHVRVHQGRQADRRRRRPRQPHRDAAGAGVAARPVGQARDGDRQEPPPHVPEPDVDAVRGAAARMARDRPARADRRREGHGEARRMRRR